MMNHEEQSERNPVYRTFRNSLDIGMGVFYLVIAFLIFSVRYFGTIELSATYAYILGSLMAVYGAFRIYRGLAGMRQNRRKR